MNIIDLLIKLCICIFGLGLFLALQDIIAELSKLNETLGLWLK